MALKLLALGCTRYWSDGFNRFDGGIAMVSLVDVSESFLGLEVVDAAFLRTLRLLRIFRLLRARKSLQRLIAVVGSAEALEALLWLLFLLALVIFTFALLGMQLFGGQYGPPEFADGPPRHHFDSIASSLITVFVVTTGESWDEVYLDATRAAGHLSILYFLPLIFAATYLVLNLLMAVIFATFASASSAHADSGTEAGCCIPWTTAE